MIFAELVPDHHSFSALHTIPFQTGVGGGMEQVGCVCCQWPYFKSGELQSSCFKWGNKSPESLNISYLLVLKNPSTMTHLLRPRIMEPEETAHQFHVPRKQGRPKTFLLPLPELGKKRVEKSGEPALQGEDSHLSSCVIFTESSGPQIERKDTRKSVG